jgi:GH35 family endo-1,4-beta-xylanase
MEKSSAIKQKLLICALSVSFLLPGLISKAQYAGINDSIVKYRKGQIIVRAKKGSNITVEQLRHEFWFGCAIPNSLAGNMRAEDLKMFKQKFIENFNSAVTENSLKWAVMEPQKDKEIYYVTDSILAWTDRNNIQLRGHNLFWGIFKSPNTGQQYVQPWVAALSDDELRQRIHDRAIRITKYYKGRFAEYDLNNEMIHGNYYADRLGEGIVKQMADWAHEGDPDAKFFVNDYDILIKDSPLGIGLPEYMAHIRKLLKDGVPISGIGVQGHSFLETFDRQYVKDALDSLAKFKIPIRITEFNMPGMRSTLKNAQLTQEQEIAKAKEIVDFYKICFAHPAVEGIIMWGFWQGANWVPSSSLYKRDWTPTPSAEAYRNLVFNEWWTKVSGTADRKGVFSVPAYYGKYRITVDGKSKEIDLSKKSGSVTVDFR